MLLRLVEAHCVPILAYDIEVTDMANFENFRDKRRSLRMAHNSIFRKLFCYRYYERVPNLQHTLGQQTWEKLVDKRKLCFYRWAYFPYIYVASLNMDNGSTRKGFVLVVYQFIVIMRFIDIAFLVLRPTSCICLSFFPSRWRSLPTQVFSIVLSSFPGDNVTNTKQIPKN